MIDSMLRAAQTYGRDDVDADRYVAETSTIAAEFGIGDPPRSAAELADTLEGFRPELAGDEHTREVVRFLLRPPLPRAARPVYQVLVGAATQLLPEWAAQVLDLPRRSQPLQALDRVAAGSVLGILGVVLGKASPAEQVARQRIAEHAAGAEHSSAS